MKKLLSVSLKTIAFFVGWAICAAMIPIPETGNAALWRFWAELIPLLAVMGFTLIFWFIEKRKIKLHLIEKPVYNIVLGCITGSVWIGTSVGILSLIGVIHIDGRNQIPMLWLFSAFINTIMQEMLVRGCLYQMIKSNYNIISAAIVSTGFFVLAHGGALDVGLLPVLNVISMSLFMTAVLEYTDSLIAPIVIHFLWNGIGAILFGGVSLADDYPHLFNMTIRGNQILSGGSCKMEGSIVVLLINLILMTCFAIAIRKQNRKNRLSCSERLG